MALTEQVIPITFTSGVETKSDPKTVLPAKLLRAENCVFTAPGRISKRNGYTRLGTTIASVGTMSAPKLAHGYGSELLSQDSNTLLSYSSNQDAWYSKGSYNSVDLSRFLVADSSTTSGIADVAILNNYALYGYSDLAGTVYGKVVDLSTGDILLTQTLDGGLGVASAPVKCVLLGGTTLAIIYQLSTTQYSARTVSFGASGVVSFSGATVITTNATGPFDIIETSTGGAFIYAQSTTPGITMATLSTALAVSTSTIAATLGNVAATVVAISKTSNGNLWGYWNETTDDGANHLTASSIYYAVKTSALVAVLNRTLVVATAAPYYIASMIAKGDSTTQQTLYYSLFATTAGTTYYYEYTRYITATSAGVVGSSTLFANGVIPFSKAFTVGSSIYAVFFFRSVSFSTLTMTNTTPIGVQPTLFMVELTNLQSPPLVVARWGSGVASTSNGRSQNKVFPQNMASFSSTKYYFACGITIQASPVTTTFIAGELGAYSYAFDFSHANASIAKNCSNITVLNGGVMQMYDGANCVEWGFHLSAEVQDVTTSAAGGSIADGTYQYLAISQWTDNQGNVHQSAPSPVKSITTAGGGTSTNTIYFTANFLTRKPNSTVYIYRTKASGSVFYLIAFSAAPPTSTGVFTMTDTASDATIGANIQAYTYPASSVLENSTPPPSMITLSHNNRLWFVDSENPNTIWYTKSVQNLVGLSPSAFLTEQIDAKSGNITALAEMDEKLVIGKSSGFFLQSGDGADDTGANSTLSFPQVVPSDVGVSEAKSVILQPNGVMFKSPNGIYILTRSLQIFYIGSDVESYNSQTITSANLVPGKSQIRFLCSTGLTLVYDYIYNQWATFTNHTGNSATNWNSLYVYSTGSAIFKESAGSYLDNATAFALLAQTSWLSFASIQGFQRIRRLIMLGDYANGASASHNLSISSAYDFSTTFQSAITYAFGAASSSGVFQYRERLPIQKCDSLSLLIQETTTGSALEYVDLTNISFEAGVKRGVNKLRGQQSVG